MVKINKPLLPIKAHYLFFMASMGPILPQLPVLGKQIGISADVMGYITSVLPILYVVAKPCLGFVADYFTSLRKFIFIVLIAIMAASFGGLYFIPKPQLHAINAGETWYVEFNVTNAQLCDPQLLTSNALCGSTRPARCSNNATNFIAHFTDIDAEPSKSLNLSSNLLTPQRIHVCLPPGAAPNISTTVIFNGNCLSAGDLQADCLSSSASFWAFVVCMCLGTIGFNVVNSISDAICFDMLGDAEDKYGAQRVWGTIGFGVTALLSGIVVDLWTTDSVKSVAPALLIMFVFCGLDVHSVSKLKLPALSASKSIFKDVCSLVSHPAIAIFLVFATIAGIIDSFIIYFMFWHMEEVAAETGFTDQIKLIEGCVVAAECLAGEVPFFFYSGKIIKKLGYVHCMSMCFFFYTVRLALIAWIPNPWYLVGVELFFQGCTYALSYTCIVAYAAAVAPPGTSATVQGLMAGMDDGLGFSIGSLIGGLALQRFGGRRSFSYFAIMAACTCVAHILIRPFSRKQQYLPNTGYEEPPEQVVANGNEADVKVL